MVTPAAHLVFPHQLHAPPEGGREERHYYLIEDGLFFRQYPFHVRKLIFHRASMKAWEEHAKSCGHRVSYIDAHDARAATASLFEYLSAEGVDDVHVDDPVDYLLMRRLQRESHRTEVRLHVGESRLFLDTRAEVDDYFQGRRRMLMH
ncbi:MAG: cryptochrome/photolyase family protein, partial [Bacteroidota bacterium]